MPENIASDKKVTQDGSMSDAGNDRRKNKAGLTLLQKIAVGISAIGPGLFLIGYNIGTGSVTTMAMAGAQYGMSLLWALVLSGIFTYILMVAFGHLTLVTGHTALYNFKHKIPKFGKAIALYVMIALILGELVAVMGIMGIVAELIQEGIRIASVNRSVVVHTGYIISVISIFIFLGLWFGKYKLFEKILTTFVILMFACFVVVFFMVTPSYTALIKGMIPGIPDTPGAFRLVAAMAGTTCSAAVFIVRSTVVAEKGWSIKDLKAEKKDAAVSAFMMVLLSSVIMAVAAGTLHVMGLSMENTLDLVRLLEPLGGDIASFIMIVGICGAGLSTIIPIVMIAPWLVADYMGLERDLKSPLFRTLIIIGLICTFGSVFMDSAPPIIMVAAMALQAMILPAIAIPAYYLMNKKEMVGEENLPSARWNAGMIAVIIFSVITAYFAIRGFLP